MGVVFNFTYIGRESGCLVVSESMFFNTGLVILHPSPSGYIPATLVTAAAKTKPFSVEIRNSLFHNITGMSIRELKKITFENCSFSDEHRRGSELIIEIINVDEVQINNSKFSNYQLQTEGFVLLVKHAGNFTMISSHFSNLNGGDSFVFLWFVRNVFVSECVFSDRSTDGDHDFGCLVIMNVKTGVVENSSFSRCRSILYGGGLTVMDNAKSFVVRQCLFEENFALKTGGAVFFALGIKYRDGESKFHADPVKIENCEFKNNEAGAAGQSVYSSVKIDMNNITIYALKDKNNNIPYIQLSGNLVKLGNINMITESPGLMQSMLVKRGVSISSDDLQIYDKINFVCPKHFNVKVDQTSYVGKRTDEGNWQTQYDMVYTSLDVQCQTCPPHKYTLKRGAANVHPFLVVPFYILWTKGKWNQNVSDDECLECPPGAKCNGNIVPIDNYWGYKLADSNHLQFSPCPTGYCCSSQSTPCSDYQTCGHGREDILCGSCAEGFSQNFIDNGCIMKLDEEECDHETFLMFFLALSQLYTIVFTFLPCIVDVGKSMWSYLKSGCPKNHARSYEAETDDEKNSCIEKESINSIKIASGDKGNARDDFTNIGVEICVRKEERKCIPFGAYITTIVLFFQV